MAEYAELNVDDGYEDPFYMSCSCHLGRPPCSYCTDYAPYDEQLYTLYTADSKRIRISEVGIKSLMEFIVKNRVSFKSPVMVHFNPQENDDEEIDVKELIELVLKGETYVQQNA